MGGPRPSVATTTLSFEKSQQEPSPRGPSPREQRRVFQRPEAADTAPDAFVWSTVVAGHVPFEAGEGADVDADAPHQRSGAAAAPQRARPWSGVLFSKPLWGAHPKDRPVVLGAFPPAYRNMQPEVKKLLDENDVATHVPHRAQHGLTTGLKALLAESDARKEILQDSSRTTGKGSRIARAHDEKERKIQERLERLAEKEREKRKERELESEGEKAQRESSNKKNSNPQPAVLTGWHERTESAQSMDDVPTPEGVVRSISEVSTSSARHGSNLHREKRPLQNGQSSQGDGDRFHHAAGLAGKHALELQHPVSPDAQSPQAQALTSGLRQLLHDSNARAQNVAGRKSDSYTGKGSRMNKVELEKERKIQVWCGVVWCGVCWAHSDA